jgi:hypothetical protein
MRQTTIELSAYPDHAGNGYALKRGTASYRLVFALQAAFGVVAAALYLTARDPLGDFAPQGRPAGLTVAAALTCQPRGEISHWHI